MSGIVKGTRLHCLGFPKHQVTVRRVAKDGSWVDVFVYDLTTRTSWSKRMPLPLTDAWRVVRDA